MAEYTIQLDEELRLVRATIRGVLTRETGFDIITNVLRQANENGFGVFSDVRGVDHQVSLADWFFLPRKLMSLQKGPTRLINVAVVIDPDNKEEYAFFENVARNVGLSFQAFLAEDKALAWLADKQSG